MTKAITIAVDAMGGDNSPKKIVEGINLHYKKSKNIFYKIFGDTNILNKIVPSSLPKKIYELNHTNESVKDTDTPLSGAKKGKNTSMWLAIESVKNKQSDIVISAGNTGALFVIAKLNFKMIENIDKPALSGLWPNKNGMNVVLDLGANIECSEKNLIEGNEIMNSDVNVIVTDGFTGNVALKTAEGTANFITSELKKAMTGSLIGKLSSLLNIKNLNKFKKRLDPRLYNGAIFLGLDSPVVKSHGSTDSLGFSYSLNMCEKIVKGNLIDKIKQSID